MTGPRPEADAEPRAASGARIDIAALRLVLLYAAFAALWILLSDEMMGLLYSDPAALVRTSMVKGWLFVAVTALLLYGLVCRLLDKTLAASRREIAAQKEKAHALQLLAAIADNSTDAIFAKDLDGRYLLCNREAARIIGRPGELALGCDDSAFLPPQQAEMLRGNDRRVIADNRINTYEEMLSTVDGERTYLTIKGPLRDGEGHAIGVFGIARDITERQQAETALRATVEELARFNRLTVGREMDMIALKQQVNELSRQLGREPPFALAMLDATAPGQETAAR